MRSHRMSLGGNGSALRDSSSRQNTRSSSSSRRQSLGGALKAETPSKDRRALLDEWRKDRNVRGRDEEENENNKRLKVQESPNLPRTTSTSSFQSTSSGYNIPEGTSALERIRMRKQQKLQQQQQQQQQQATHSEHALPPQHPTQQKSTICFYDDDEDNTGDYSNAASSLVSAGTPSRALRGTPRRGLGGGARLRRKSYVPRPQTLSQDDDPPPLPLSQITTQSAPTPSKPIEAEVDSVEGAGLRSRLQEMGHRIEKLEKEKRELFLSKAPLEARFRQKEDTWIKEQTRLVQEIESLMQASKAADERCRDLQEKYDSLEQECKALRFAARKAASSLNSNQADNSIFSRQLQNDRDVSDLKEKLRCAEDEIKFLRLEKVSVEKEVNATKIELDALIRNYDELQEEYDAIEASSSENSEAEIKLQVLTTEHVATSAQLNAVCSDLAGTKARAQAAKEAMEEEHKREIDKLHFDMSVLKTRAGKVVDLDEATPVDDDEDDAAVMKARVEERDRKIIELEAQLLKGEQLRRQMHNRIQELRGNIRVFVRTRPFLPGDGDNHDSSIEASPDGESLSIADTRSKNRLQFKFDQVFPPSAGQDAVFDEVCDFVQSALDGYHVCLFSYGQTGSGKTHTMQGSGNGAMRGIIPRAVEQILAQAKSLKSQNWTFQLRASFLEIYNEDLKDLLATLNKGGSSNSKGRTQKLAIKRNREGKSFVEGLTEHLIETSDSAIGMSQLEELMASAARSRSVASTKMNAQSSRSHSVFMLHLHGVNEASGAIVHGALNLCDLAGSERLDRSGAGSDMKRLKETQAINKSLSCLGDVFNALATGASHVPYRNSKLTYLLQDCLSGDGKALMFVNLSPTFASSNESVCSLRFAQRVNQVELGKATKHIEYSGR